MITIQDRAFYHVDRLLLAANLIIRSFTIEKHFFLIRSSRI